MNYCNCIKGSPESHSMKFRIVKADKDTICLDCGHYTLVAPQEFGKVTTEARRNNNSKYSEETIKEILRLLKTDMKQTEIAKKIGVHKSLVGGIKRGTVWSNITIKLLQ